MVFYLKKKKKNSLLLRSTSSRLHTKSCLQFLPLSTQKLSHSPLFQLEYTSNYLQGPQESLWMSLWLVQTHLDHSTSLMHYGHAHQSLVLKQSGCFPVFKDIWLALPSFQNTQLSDNKRAVIQVFTQIPLSLSPALCSQPSEGSPPFSPYTYFTFLISLSVTDFCLFASCLINTMWTGAFSVLFAATSGTHRATGT